ncbi:MAG: helix-turn-helix domain-containing protein [Oscillospiraceae bacterium]|nr:helix-turn-helix domain-containing protein [Oscillospiraceae bacterium]
MKIDDFRKLAAFEFQHTQEDHQKLYEFLHSIGIDPSRVYQELEMSSPYVDTHRDTSYSNATVSLHSHVFYELLYCRSATDVEYLVGSERYRLRNGDIVFISPGISHRPILPDGMDGTYVRDVIWLSPEYMENLKEMFPYILAQSGDYLIRTSGTRWEFLGELFASGIREREEQQPGWEPLVLANTMAILVYLNRAYSDRSTGIMKAEKPDLLGKVTAYIETNYAQHITISELARRFYVSESTISHLFKQKMGISIYHYVTQRRLISAKNRIVEGIALEQVATQVGFSDYSAFYRAFKQEYGISPRQYRQKIL